MARVSRRATGYRKCSRYTTRRDFTIDACERYWPAGIASWKPAQTGMFQWLKVDCSSHPHVKSKTAAEIEEEIYLESIKQGALVARGSWFRVLDGRPCRDDYFRITFAAASLDKIAEAVKRFGNAVDELFHESREMGQGCALVEKARWLGGDA